MLKSLSLRVAGCFSLATSRAYFCQAHTGPARLPRARFVTLNPRRKPSPVELTTPTIIPMALWQFQIHVIWVEVGDDATLVFCVAKNPPSPSQLWITTCVPARRAPISLRWMDSPLQARRPGGSHPQFHQSSSVYTKRPRSSMLTDFRSTIHFQ